MAAGILFMSFDAEEMRLHLKPLSELRYFLRTYGRAGISVFLLQHLYYLLESALILFIIVFGQEAGESLFPVRRTSLIPWGGIFCALTWGMLHGLTKDWETALFSLILSAFFCTLLFCRQPAHVSCVSCDCTDFSSLSLLRRYGADTSVCAHGVHSKRAGK